MWDKAQVVKGSGSVRLLQFTDLHLYDHQGETLLGVNTDWSFSAVVQLAKNAHWPPDLILVTGDMVHSGSINGYQKLLKELQSFNCPTFCLAGNHDIPENMHRVLNAGSVKTSQHVTIGKWHIYLLDSTIEGEEKGRLSKQQVDLLDSNLQMYPDDYHLVTLHHPPFEVGSHWLDAMALENPQDLFRVLDRYPKVKCVLCGHVHQAFEKKRNQMRLLCSPSTCVQFKPRCREFAVDTQTPAYRWLELTENGEVITGINRLDQLPADIDIAASGY